MRTKIRLEPLFDNGQFYVIEKLFDGKGNVEEQQFGPFATYFERDCFMGQRAHWLETQVKQGYNKKRVAEPFVFLWPPP